MKIKIYRGTEEIGGTCIELKADNGKILWLDLGIPLNSSNPDISYSKNPLDALLISHPHQDHYGLMESLDPVIPVYMGQISLDLINTTRRFLGLGPLKNTIYAIHAWSSFTIAATFRVYPYLVDHSSPEAFAFMIEVDGKRIFYTGDLRSSGRKGKLFDRIISNPPKDIDLLLTEGTMIERRAQKYETEEQVEKAITDIVVNQQNLTYVVSAAQNIDRFCSVFNACRAGKKMLVIDVYSAFLLEIVGRKSDRLPTVAANRILVYASESQMDKIASPEFDEFRRKIKLKTPHNGVFVKPEKFVYFVRVPNEKMIDKMRHKGEINLIYSQWLGYLEDENRNPASNLINKLRGEGKVRFHHIHTSGHASLEEIVELAKAISPTLTVPIHTDNPEKVRSLFANSGLMNVDLRTDRQEFTI